MMSTIFFLAGLIAVTLGLGFAALVILSSSVQHGRRLLRMLGAAPSEAHCPRTGQRTSIRLGMTDGATRPSVLYCERFGCGELRCNAECFPRLNDVSQRLAA